MRNSKFEEILKDKFPEVVLLGGKFNGTDEIWEEFRVFLDRDPCPEKDKEIEKFIRNNFLKVGKPGATKASACKKVVFERGCKR